MSVTGQVVMITGAASGLGRAQVWRFLRDGARVVGVDVDAAGLDRLQDALAAGDECLLVQADLTRTDDIARVVGAAIGRFGRIDVLSNTAGILDGFARSLDVSDELWDRVFDVNVKSVFRLTNAVLPGMLERGRGTIINIASAAGLVAAGGAAYTASKHAVVGYTRQLSSDYARRGIKANAICPGLIESPMTREALADPKFAAAVTRIPAGRYGQPDEVAGLAVFLAGPDSDFMHGAAIPVDGGLTAR